MAMIKTVINEPKRGCRYRKEGGLYLVSGRGAQVCGKLLIPLDVCPTCSAATSPRVPYGEVNLAVALTLMNFDTLTK